MRAPHPWEPQHDPPESLALPHLFSKAIHQYTISFEQESQVSLAHRANVLRVLTTEGRPAREIPALAGVSKEALKMAYGFLIKAGHLLEEPSASGRGKDVRLTDLGALERDRYAELHKATEQRWEKEFTLKGLSRLRTALAQILSHDAGTESPLLQGLKPPPNTWRAQLPKLRVLPHHPMVLHRGGWPDGS